MTQINLSPRNISSAMLLRASAGFLRNHPIHTDDDGNDLYTLEEWLSIYAWQRIEDEARDGDDKIRNEAAEKITFT